MCLRPIREGFLILDVVLGRGSWNVLEHGRTARLLAWTLFHYTLISRVWAPILLIVSLGIKRTSLSDCHFLMESSTMCMSSALPEEYQKINGTFFSRNLPV